MIAKQRTELVISAVQTRCDLFVREHQLPLILDADKVFNLFHLKFLLVDKLDFNGYNFFKKTLTRSAS